MWSYSVKEKAFFLIFSFADSEKEDERNYYDEYSLKILSMEENGDVTFAVYGYMKYPSPTSHSACPHGSSASRDSGI